MKRVLGLGLLVLGVVGWGLGRPCACADDDAKKDTVVEIDDLKSRAPADWEPVKTTSDLRVYQFRIAPAKGDKRDAEFVIFYFGGQGGTAADNVKRWKGMFNPPRGKTIDDVSKVAKMKAGSVDMTYLDVHGTYKEKFPPFAPNAKVTERPDYRMLAVVFESPKGPYFFRLVGPARTVGQHKKGFDDWLKGFK
ncbi:MAG TPA: hypothetical protein VG013_41540 [Gemmataceae bacterium]|jgi:hypothetical protein|nr:hypothetical protein [Gemmataceae bacterium]